MTDNKNSSIPLLDYNYSNQFKSGNSNLEQKLKEQKNRVHSRLRPIKKQSSALSGQLQSPAVKESTAATSCHACSKEFSSKSSLNRHLKEKHGPEGSKEPAKNFTCGLCDKKFKRGQHLTEHVGAVHLQGEQLKCDKCDFKTVMKRHLARHCKNHKEKKSNSKIEDTSRKYHCTQCPKRYKKETLLNIHMRDKHGPGGKKQPVFNKKCPLCHFTASHAVARVTRKNMLAHFEEKHNLSMDFEDFEFGSVDEYKSWKTRVESESSMKFTVLRINEKTLRVTCHRSGFFISKGRGERSLKKSCKINGYCPASMTVKITDSGRVKVLFQKRHIGHGKEVKYVLNKGKKKKPAVSVAGEIPCGEIVGSLKRDVSDGNPVRLHLTRRRRVTKREKVQTESDDWVVQDEELYVEEGTHFLSLI